MRSILSAMIGIILVLALIGFLLMLAQSSVATFLVALGTVVATYSMVSRSKAKTVTY